MIRREFIAGLGCAAVWPLVARAQQGDRVRRIGVLSTGVENDPEGKRRYSAFTQTLADLGWTDGRNVRIDFRRAGNDVNRMRALAQELVGLQPDILVGATTPATAALQRETRTIPIVFGIVGDPVGSGFVASLNQPGGNMTGFGVWEPSLGGKWLELLSEITPELKRVAALFNPDTAPGSYGGAAVSAVIHVFSIGYRRIGHRSPNQSRIDSPHRHPLGPERRPRIIGLQTDRQCRLNHMKRLEQRAAQAIGRPVQGSL